jgi:hypothetical protein
MNKSKVVRNYYVLPCCLLLLNLCVGVVSYKAQLIADHFIRTAAIIAMVLFGGSFVGFVMSPAIGWAVTGLHRRSRRTAGMAGEVLFLLLLGATVYWLYYRMYILGPQAVLPRDWRNH